MHACAFDPEQLGELARRLYEESDGTVMNEYRQCFTAAALASRRKLLVEPLTANQFAAHRALLEGSELCIEVLASAGSLLQRGKPA